MIAENLAQVKRRLSDAVERSGRDPESVRLVAVTKQVETGPIAEARRAGAVVFGENKVQDAREKIESLGSEGIEWHFIGHLQKNKIKYVFALFDLIHSVDSAALAESIHEKAVAHGTVMPILLQVNVSGEASKFGMEPETVPEVLRAVAPLEGIRIRGLMTIPPYDPDPERSRPYYIRLRELRDTCSRLKLPGVSLDELSMGMSGDYEVAVEEGATLVRVGTAIFGPRPSVL
ncbi:MAG: YggS family pyridoxal phosphate-dependent enzyme [Nitrospinae bacterium]|nr:YggS family pyridoxal phosphate-dependent enzyme [Nitrospinota bacterium]